MVFPIEIMWAIPVLIAFLLGLLPKCKWTFTFTGLLTIAGLSYFICRYSSHKQGVLLMAVIMGISIIVGPIIVAALVGMRVKLLPNKNRFKVASIICLLFIVTVGSYSFYRINKIRKDKDIINQAIILVKTDPIVLKEVGNNSKALLFKQEYAEEKLSMLEIRVKGEKTLYAIIDVHKKDKLNPISLRCLTKTPPQKRLAKNPCASPLKNDK
jgi:hypothetical protein